MKTTLTLMLACLALLATGCGGFVKGKAASEVAITRFHQLYNEGEFDSIWRESHSKFRSDSTQAKFNTLMRAALRKLGKVKSTTNSGWKINSYNFKTTVIMTQTTVFERGKTTETFTFEMDGENAVLLGYDIHSTNLMENEPVEI